MKKTLVMVASVTIPFACMMLLGNIAYDKYLRDVFKEQVSLTYSNLPFPPVMQEVEAGQTIPLMVARCNTSSEPMNYNTTRTLENIDTHQAWLLPEQRALLMPGCSMSVTRLNVVPADTPPGRYIVYGVAEVRGERQMHFVDWRSQPFTVVVKK